ncbi:Lymphocyte antigen 6E, partial [Haliaeetus albicilla]
LLTEVCLSLAAHTLVCFSCSDASSNWACLTPVKCGENENHCVTTYVGVGIG